MFYECVKYIHNLIKWWYRVYISLYKGDYRNDVACYMNCDVGNAARKSQFNVNIPAFTKLNESTLEESIQKFTVLNVDHIH